MKIRKALEYEIKNLAEVEMSSGYHKERFNFEPYLHELIKKNTDILCAEAGTILVGYITLNYTGRIDFLTVSKKYQRRGIASSLLKRVISTAKREKMKKLYLEVKNDNTPAISLYLKNGFIITSSFVKNIGCHKTTKLRMEKKLR